MKPQHIFIIMVLLAGCGLAQSRTNLEVFYNLVDSSVSMLPADIKNGRVAVSAGNNILIYNYTLEKLHAKYGNVSLSEKDFDISYVIENIKVEYGDIFRKKFLGDYYIERNFHLEGNAVIHDNFSSVDFNITYSDTVKFDNIKELESSIHPFTRADVPAEPLLQGIVEPIVAVGAAAAAIVLFFIIRSK